MMDSPSAPPEVTIEPADNGFVVRHYQRSTKKDEGGRTIRRVASTTDEALSHAKAALGGRVSKKKSAHRGDGAPSEDTPSEHAGVVSHQASHSSRGRARRRRPRAGGRRA